MGELINYEKKKIIINSSWIKEERWDLLANEISVIFGKNAILTSINDMIILDEFGLQINEYLRWSFDYSMRRKFKEMERDIDDY